MGRPARRVLPFVANLADLFHSRRSAKSGVLRRTGNLIDTVQIIKIEPGLVQVGLHRILQFWIEPECPFQAVNGGVPVVLLAGAIPAIAAGFRHNATRQSPEAVGLCTVLVRVGRFEQIVASLFELTVLCVVKSQFSVCLSQAWIQRPGPPRILCDRFQQAADRFAPIPRGKAIESPLLVRLGQLWIADSKLVIASSHRRAARYSLAWLT